jgi:choline dehydrogenase-like flavoprotein
MDCFDIIVVGSGPGAAFAAYGARGRRILVLDVGHAPHEFPELNGNLYDLRRRREDLFGPLIGDEFENLHNVHRRTISLKLKTPGMSFIVSQWEQLSPAVSNTFEGAISHAKGGFANAWGAGVYRFTNRDLAGFPIRADDLKPFYDMLTAKIGISGTNDDLEPYFVRDDFLQPALQLSPFFAEFLAAYERSSQVFKKERVLVGRPRLAVLTKPHDGRSAYNYDNLEFFRPHNPAIYTPAYTIDEMARSGLIAYQSGRLVLRYRETADAIEVTARNLQSGQEEVWRGKRLCLGAGTLNTARIVLASNEDHEARLPILDNPMACIPFFKLARIGEAVTKADTSIAQLNLVAEDDEIGEPVQATIYGAAGPLRSDVLFNLPLALRGNLVLARHLTAASGLLMLFYPREPMPDRYLRLLPSGEIEVEFGPAESHEIERRIIRLLRKIGYVSHPALIQRPGAGAGFHYAGALPMRERPGRYETDSHGLLAGTKRIYIVDGASFSRLPSKNLTFTIMANALRIGQHVASQFA